MHIGISLKVTHFSDKSFLNDPCTVLTILYNTVSSECEHITLCFYPSIIIINHLEIFFLPITAVLNMYLRCRLT